MKVVLVVLVLKETRGRSTLTAWAAGLLLLLLLGFGT